MEVALRDGVEFHVAPTEPLTGSTQAGKNAGISGGPFNVVAPAATPVIAWFTPVTNPTGLVGNRTPTNPENTNAVFEFGTTLANVASYSMSVDRQQMANYIYVPRVGFPEPGRTGTTAHEIASDATAIGTVGRLEAWVDPGEITLQSYRAQLAAQQLNLRVGPRRLIQFQPVTNAELQPWLNYVVGDYVRFRAFQDSTLRFDVNVRIWSIAASLDAQGNESVTVSTLQEA